MKQLPFFPSFQVLQQPVHLPNPSHHLQWGSSTTMRLRGNVLFSLTQPCHAQNSQYGSPFDSFSPQPDCQVDFVFPNGSSSSGINLNAKDVTLQPFPDAALTTISTTDTTTTTSTTVTTTTITTTTTTTTTEDLGCNSNSSLCLGFDALCQVGHRH